MLNIKTITQTAPMQKCETFSFIFKRFIALHFACRKTKKTKLPSTQKVEFSDNVCYRVRACLKQKQI